MSEPVSELLFYLAIIAIAALWPATPKPMARFKRKPLARTVSQWLRDHLFVRNV